MQFREWIDDFPKWKNIVTGLLNLNPDKGLSQTLDGFDANDVRAKLSKLAEFAKLSDQAQTRALSVVDTGGSVGELVKALAGRL